MMYLVILQRNHVGRRLEGSIGRESGFERNVDGRLDASSEKLFFVPNVDNEDLRPMIERAILRTVELLPETADVDHVFGGNSRTSLAFQCGGVERRRNSEVGVWIAGIRGIAEI